MGAFLFSLLAIGTGAVYAFDINGYSSRRNMTVFSRVIGWIFFIAGILIALLVSLDWILGLIVGHLPASRR
jgi:hypothetical protein